MGQIDDGMFEFGVPDFEMKEVDLLVVTVKGAQDLPEMQDT